MRSIRYPSLLLALILAGCAPDGTDRGAEGAAPTEAAGGTSAPPTASAAISPEYLAGPWCFAYYEAGGEREEEGVTYVFREDGTLLYQTNPTTAVDQQGSYAIGGDALEIRPTLAVAPREVGSVSENGFTLGTGSTRFVFTRGACE